MDVVVFYLYCSHHVRREGVELSTLIKNYAPLNFMMI
jgi:hypothetical protein